MGSHIRIMTWIGTLFVLIPLAVRAHEAPEAQATQARAEIPVEPPREPVRRERMPTSPRMIAVRGLHTSIQVNVDGVNDNIVGDAANEPSIAIDPADPDTIVIGWRQFDTVTSSFRQAGWAYSHDGGASWTFPGVLQPGQFRSDPVLSADTLGNIFYYSLSSTTTTEMFISSDGGVTWTAPISAPGGDKTWMTIDTTGGMGNDHVYMLWNSQFTCCAPGTDFTRSIDGGLSYQGPFGMPQHPKWGTLDIGPDGELYVVGATLNNASHLLLRSTNAQNSGQPPIFELAGEIDLGGTTITGGVPNPGGLMGQVWVAVDRSTELSRGNVYVLGSVNPSGSDPLDVMFIRSVDGGMTWTPPMTVHDPLAGAGSYQWFGTMSVAPDGRIDVVWNDTRNDPTHQTSELYYAYSTDSGTSWSDGLPVSPPFNSLVGQPQQAKIGDYYHMISDADGGALAYAATFNGEQDVYFLRVGDCNANGAHDATDIANLTSLDCNTNGIPDECEVAASCDDGLFCNGIETCMPGGCLAGVPPDCNDGDSCTVDACDEAADTCSNVAPPAPGEAGNLQLALLPGATAKLSWDPTPQAATYEVYRGMQRDASDLDCLLGGVASTTAPDDGATPAEGLALFHVVRAVNCAGPGPLGAGRAAATTCP